MTSERSDVAVVVSGGGARGAYEAGLLSVLLPALEAADQKPSIFLGTSAGAINAVAFASLNHLSASDAAATALDLWRKVRAPSVFRSPLHALRGALAPHGRTGTRRGAALLDNTPLAQTLEAFVNWDQLRRNVAAGSTSVGVIATAASTHHSTVFLQASPQIRCPASDPTRSIDYVATRLAPDHVLASAAIPVAFPAIEIGHPGGSDWYIDGGLRLNTPLKPAVELGAKHIVVLATDPADTWVKPIDRPARWHPTLAGGAAQVAYAVLTDRMVEDVRTLASRNREATPTGVAGPDAIDWLFGGPPSRPISDLAELAGAVMQGGAPGSRPRGPVRRLLRRTLGRWLARDPHRLELLTHLHFDPAFIDGAILLGQRDARRCLDGSGAPVWHLTGTVGATIHGGGTHPCDEAGPAAAESVASAR